MWHIFQMAILSNIFMGNIFSSTRAVLKEREKEGFQVYPLMSMSVVCGGFTPGTPVSTDCINYYFICMLIFVFFKLTNKSFSPSIE